MPYVCMQVTSICTSRPWVYPVGASVASMPVSSTPYAHRCVPGQYACSQYAVSTTVASTPLASTPQVRPQPVRRMYALSQQAIRMPVGSTPYVRPQPGRCTYTCSQYAVSTTVASMPYVRPQPVHLRYALSQYAVSTTVASTPYVRPQPVRRTYDISQDAVRTPLARTPYVRPQPVCRTYALSQDAVRTPIACLPCSCSVQIICSMYDVPISSPLIFTLYIHAITLININVVCLYLNVLSPLYDVQRIVYSRCLPCFANRFFSLHSLRDLHPGSNVLSPLYDIQLIVYSRCLPCFTNMFLSLHSLQDLHRGSVSSTNTKEIFVKKKFLVSNMFPRKQTGRTVYGSLFALFSQTVFCSTKKCFRSLFTVFANSVQRALHLQRQHRMFTAIMPGFQCSHQAVSMFTPYVYSVRITFRYAHSIYRLLYTMRNRTNRERNPFFATKTGQLCCYTLFVVHHQCLRKHIHRWEHENQTIQLIMVRFTLTKVVSLFFQQPATHYSRTMMKK